MRRFTFALILVLAAASTACLRSTTMIELKPDGSGTIVQETGMSAQALAMLKSFAGNDQAGTPPPDLFGEEQARKMAASMGVTFVSGEPLKTAELEGYRARFAFDDISKVALKMEPGGSGAMPAASPKEPPFNFNFDRRPASSTLTINLPPQNLSKPPLPGIGGAQGNQAQAAQALAMMKTMMKGLYVDISMNVNGRILKTNAPFVEGSRITLMQIDFDKVLADESALAKLQGATDLKTLASVPGLKIVSEPKINVEFGK